MELTAKQLYDKQHYQKHKQKRNRQTAEWYVNNKEKAKALNKAGYQKLGKDEKLKRAKFLRQTYPQHAMFIRSRISAKSRGISFDLEESDIQIPEFCPVFNVKLEFAGQNRNNSASLDRIDNTKGYVKGNVWVISNRANKIKANLTVEELEMLVNAIKKVRVTS